MTEIEASFVHNSLFIIHNSSPLEYNNIHLRRTHKWDPLPFLERITFQRLFHPPFGVLFTVPSRYYPLLISAPSLALDGGPPGFGPDYTCPTLLRILLPPSVVSSTGLSPSWAARSRAFACDGSV